MVTPNKVGRLAGNNAVFIFKQEASDDIDIKITISKAQVLYQTMTKEGEVLSDIISARPYNLDSSYNDGTTKNCLHALLEDYFFHAGINPIKNVKPEYLPFHNDCVTIGKREVVHFPPKWNFTQRLKLRKALVEVGLEWLAKMVH